MEYGGFEMEYIHKSDKLTHWTVHTLIGGGTARLRVHDPRSTLESGRFYIVEPSLNVDVNITTWFRIGVGGGYRIVFGLDLEEVTSSDLCGPSGLIIFKFGSF
jgi:hypothetical protein